MLDQAAAADSYDGHYGAVRDTWSRRFALRDRLSADLEIGDLYAMGAWIHFELGRYPEAVDYAEAIADRTQELSGGMHARAWETAALFRLGRWDDALVAFRVLRDQLDDRRDNPPGFAMHAFGAAGMILRLRGERVESERVGAAVFGTHLRSSVRAFPWRVWLRSMGGDLDGAEALLATPPLAWRTHAGLVHEARCDTVLAAGDWDEAPAVAAMVRQHAVDAPSPVTGAFADRLDGVAALARGDVGGAIELLERAVRTLDACDAPGRPPARGCCSSRRCVGRVVPPRPTRRTGRRARCSSGSGWSTTGSSTGRWWRRAESEGRRWACCATPRGSPSASSTRCCCAWRCSSRSSRWSCGTPASPSSSRGASTRWSPPCWPARTCSARRPTRSSSRSSSSRPGRR